MRGGDYGMIGDIIVALIGGFIGGLVLTLLVEGDAGLWASIAVAFAGDCILIALLPDVVLRPRVRLLLRRFCSRRSA
jgi:uncharacterized membrane protein YeaQ/YmgE (transglycosylase-associated protein family)